MENKNILLVESLESCIKERLTEIKINRSSLVIPFYRNSELEGFIICGKKSSGSAYLSEDIRLFNTIQKQVLLVLDRIRPYEKIKNDYELNQKKLYETEKFLARSEKIASMANLIQEYNHEIRTPLGVIIGKIEDLSEENKTESSITEKCQIMMKHADRIKDIVDTTLRLSQPKQRKETIVDINDIIQETLKLLTPDGFSIETLFQSQLKIICDIDDMETVFLNLIKNAKEAMENGGTLSIRTYDKTGGSESYVVVEFSDNGIGIAEDQIDRIWEPFVSRHVTKGRGLGLSIVFRIIREHLANISVSSKKDSGTTFTITLPSIKNKD